MNTEDQTLKELRSIVNKVTAKELSKTCMFDRDEILVALDTLDNIYLVSVAIKIAIEINFPFLLVVNCFKDNKEYLLKRITADDRKSKR